MPNYFFHVRERSNVRDEHGIELQDEDVARRHAVMMLGNILRDEPQTLWAAGRIQLRATTADGVVLCTLEVTSDLPEPDKRRGLRAVEK